MTGYLLRDLKRNTELLILAELLSNPSVRRREIAESLGITEQAVSQYFSKLENERLIVPQKNGVKVSRRGIQMLQERLFGLKDEIQGILRHIQVIDTCLAIASDKLKKGDNVGLLMRDGKLFAVSNAECDSRGVARQDAKPGEEILVGDLEGVVKLELGTLLALQLPSELSGGSRKVDLGRAKREIDKFSFREVAVGDVIGEIVAENLDIAPNIIYAPVQASLSALVKGLNVLFIGTRDSVKEIFDEVEALKKRTGYDITHRAIDISIEK